MKQFGLRQGAKRVWVEQNGRVGRFRLGQQRHAGHGGRQLRPQDGGGPALPRHSGEDHAAGGGHQGGQRSPGAVTAAALASELASRDASISGLQASKADASALTAYALQSAVDTSSEVGSKIAAALLNAVTTAALDAALLGKADASALASLLSTVNGLDTPLEVDTKIANALLGSLQRGTPASRRSRGPRPTRRCWPHTPRTPRSPPARPRSRAPSTQSSRSSLPCSFPAAELLTRRPGRASQLGSSFAEAASFATCTSWLLFSAALANGDDTLSITADCYSTAGTDAAALLAYYTSSQVDTLLENYRTGAAGRRDGQRHHGRAAGLLHLLTSRRAVGRLPHGERAGYADAGGHRGRAAGLQDGPGPGRVHNQPNHLGAGGVPLSRRPGHGDGLEHRSRAAQLLHHRAGGRPCGQARSHGGGLGAANSRALSGRRRGRRGGGRHRRADPGPHGRLAVKLDGSPQQRLQRGPGHAHRGRDASITALQGAKADATLLASYATNAALSTSETALQSALDAILAELAALQLSGSGVVNAPAWAGFTTWELLRGSSVVRNLHLEAPLSAALANGDDTLSSGGRCPRGCAAGLLHLLASGHSVGRLPHRASAGRGDDQRHHSRAAGLLHLLTSGHSVGRLPHGCGAGHADAGGHRGRAAGLQDGPGPGRLHNQPNHLGAGGVPFSRRPGHGDGLEHRSRAAQLLHHRTSRRPPCGQARSHGGGLGPQILGPTDVSLSNWTVRPSSGCSVVLATHTAGVSVDGYTLTLAANLWNIVRTYNLTPGRELLFACRYRLGTASNFVVYVSTGTLTSFAATGALTGATLTITGAASAGPLDCESLDCTFTATSGGVSTGSVVCGDVTSSGTVSAPQLFASNTLAVTNTSDFSDDFFC